MNGVARGAIVSVGAGMKISGIQSAQILEMTPSAPCTRLDRIHEFEIIDARSIVGR